MPGLPHSVQGKSSNFTYLLENFICLCRWMKFYCVSGKQKMVIVGAATLICSLPYKVAFADPRLHGLTWELTLPSFRQRTHGVPGKNLMPSRWRWRSVWCRSRAWVWESSIFLQSYTHNWSMQSCWLSFLFCLLSGLQEGFLWNIPSQVFFFFLSMNLFFLFI